jgi:hypothetical protein
MKKFLFIFPLLILISHNISAGDGGLVPFGRQLIISGVADPDVFVDGDQIYVMGTYDARVLPVWQVVDGKASEVMRIKPSSDDPNFDFCHLWAPDISKVGSNWVLIFVATRVANNTDCGTIGIERQQVFYSQAPIDAPSFSAPIMPDFGPGAPRSVGGTDCPADGCDKAMRIDPSLFRDTDGRVYVSYTWYNPGNHNATFALDNPTNIIRNTDPTDPDEENINEGPQIFKRNGTYYFLYSVGAFTGRYRMRYIMANSVNELTKSRGIHDLTVPVHRRDGKKYETAGHGSIAEYKGQYYAVYHIGRMSPEGNLVSRDTVISPIKFNADGTMQMLNALNLSWTAHPGHVYSIDVRTDGQWIGPCVDAGILGQNTSYQLTDLCPSGDQYTPLETIDRIRICRAPNGDFNNQAVCQETPWARDRDELFLPN